MLAPSRCHQLYAVRWQRRFIGFAAAAARPAAAKDQDFSAREPRQDGTQELGFRRWGLSKHMNLKLKKLGMRWPTKIQDHAFRPILDGQDVVGISEKATGKTFVCLVSLLERIASEGWGPLKPSVILEPSRELAEKTYVLANQLRSASCKVLLLYSGGGPQTLKAQHALMQQGAHLVIGTPGRVCEMMDAGLISLSSVQVLVLNSADMMSSQRVQHELKALTGVACDKPLPMQMLIFASDRSSWLQREFLSRMKNPLIIDLLRGAHPIQKGVVHLSCEIPAGAGLRARVVAWLLEEHFMKLAREGGTSNTKRGHRALIFASSKTDVGMLAAHAMLRHRIVAIHGQTPQQDRDESLKLFTASDGYALVTTDLAAQELRLPHISMVVHLSGPPAGDTYLNRLSQVRVASHRESGSEPSTTKVESVVLFSARYKHQLKEIERRLDDKFTPLPAPSDAELQKVAVAHISRELQAAALNYATEDFIPDATHQLELHGPRVLAAALVLLERRRRKHDWVSPLSGRVNYTPLLFLDPYLEHIRSRQVLVRDITRTLGVQPKDKQESGSAPEDAGRNFKQTSKTHDGSDPGKLHVGRVVLTAKGYMVDVHRDAVHKLLESSRFRDRGITVVPVAQLPTIIEDKRQDTSRKHQRHQKQRRRPSLLHESRAQRRLDFLFPGGRREPLGRWVRSRVQDPPPPDDP